MWWCRTIFTAVFAVVAVNAFIIKFQPTEKIYQNDVPKGWLHRQKLVMILFQDITEEANDPIISRMAENFTFYDVEGKFKDPSVIQDIKNIFEENSFLTNDVKVSEYDEDHFNQLRVLCQFLYSAKSFDTFITAAAWVRHNVNAEIFVDAFYAALMKRSDCEDIYLPPPYEIIPYNFVRAEVFNKLTTMISTKIIPNDATVHIETNVMTIDMNYTGAFFKNEEESKLAYFREDIGLNSYYFLNSLKEKACGNSTSLDGGDAGMWWYFKNQQLNARYNLERLANGFEVITDLSWNEPLVDGYDPDLYSRNMKKFPCRENFFNIQTSASFLDLIQADQDIVNYPFTDLNEKDAMNKMMRIFNDEFEMKVRKFLGGASSLDNNGGFSVMERYATSVRDPVFWKLSKHIVDIGYSFMKTLTPYTKQDLFFPGVFINSIEIKKIQTFFDYFVADVIEASDATNYFSMKVGQPRLNHKPYSISINITSAQTQKSRVKIFIGPKSSATGFQRFNSDLDATKMNFMLIDSFDFYLQTGENILTRKSSDSNFFSSDFLSSEQINISVTNSEMGMPALPKINNQNSVKFPARLSIPKGTSEGYPFRIYVIVAPYVKNDVGEVFKITFNDNVLSFGYPFDRKIEDINLFNQPNMMFKEVLIFHKGDNKVLNYGGPGITKNWYWTEPYVYDPSQSNKYKPKQEESYKSDKYKPKYDDKVVYSSQTNEASYPKLDTGILDWTDNVKIFGQKIKENEQTTESSTEYFLYAKKNIMDDQVEFNNKNSADKEREITESDEVNDVIKNLLKNSAPVLKKIKKDNKSDKSQLNTMLIEEQLNQYRELLAQPKKFKFDSKKKNSKDDYNKDLLEDIDDHKNKSSNFQANEDNATDNVYKVETTTAMKLYQVNELESDFENKTKLNAVANKTQTSFNTTHYVFKSDEENLMVPMINVVPMLTKSKTDSITPKDPKMLDSDYLKKQIKKYRDLLVNYNKLTHKIKNNDMQSQTNLEKEYFNEDGNTENPNLLEGNLFTEVDKDLDELVKDLANTKSELISTYYEDEYYPDYRIYEK